MGLDAKDKTIYSLLNDKMFIIPINQRQYVWKQDNWNDLFEDIDVLFDLEQDYQDGIFLIDVNWSLVSELANQNNRKVVI